MPKWFDSFFRDQKRIRRVLVIGLFGWLLFGLAIIKPAPETRYRYNQVGHFGCCAICRVGMPCGGGCQPRIKKCTKDFTCACRWRIEVPGEPNPMSLLEVAWLWIIAD